MKTRTSVPAVAGLTLAIMCALTGCTGIMVDQSSPEPPGTSGSESDAASSFLACLTSADVEARINDSGQIMVKAGARSDAGESASAGEGLLGTEDDDDGNTWVIPVDSSYFVDDPDTQDAYAECETTYPDFTQPEAGPLIDDPEYAEDLKAQEAAALAFAQCARDEGFTQVEDPDFSRANALQIPADLTEGDFRTLLDECWDREGPVFNLGQPVDAPYEAGAVLEEFLNSPAS